MGRQMIMWTPLAPRLIHWLCTLLPVCAISVLLLLCWSANQLWNAPYDGVDWDSTGTTVVAVARNSPAEHTGLLPGDSVGAVGEQHLNPRLSYYRQPLGSEITLNMLRAGASRTVQYALEAPPLVKQLLRIEPLVIGAIFWMISLTVWMLRPFHYIAQLFLFGGLLTSVLLATGTLSEIGVIWSGPAFNLCLLLLAPVTLHFYGSFPNPVEGKLHWFVLLAYLGAALLGSMIVLLPGAIEHAGLQFTRRLFVGVVLIAAITVLLFRSSNGSVQLHQRRYLLIFGMVASIFPLLFGSFIPQVLFGVPLLGFPWTFPFLCVLPLVYAYAVQQGELGRFDALLNRGVIYAVLLLCAIGLYKFALEMMRLVSAIPWGQAATGAALSLLGALLLLLVHRSMRYWIDRLAYGQWYDYRSLVGTMSAELNQIHDMDELVLHLFTVLRTMRFEYAVLFWQRDGKLVTRQALAACEQGEPVQLLEDGELARYLTSHGHCITHAQLARQLATTRLCAGEHAILANKRVQCWLPMVSRGMLHGVIIIGDRQGEEGLALEDLDILDTLARQAAVAAENVALIEQLRTRLEQVEQMRDELVETKNRLAESREAERLHLAQDLHDGPIQDLYGARFQINAIEDDLQTDAGRAQLYAVLATLQHVVDTLRTTCCDLRPPTLTPFGLEVAIRSHAVRFRNIHPDLDLQLDLMHDAQFIPERERIVLFRVYQESLSNIAKHAHARWACVRLELDAERILLEVRDDGCGFRVPPRWINLARQGHLGLLGMAERVSLIAGMLEVTSSEHTGTSICVIVPRPVVDVGAFNEYAYDHQSASGAVMEDS